MYIENYTYNTYFSEIFILILKSNNQKTKNYSTMWRDMYGFVQQGYQFICTLYGKKTVTHAECVILIHLKLNVP